MRKSGATFRRCLGSIPACAGEPSIDDHDDLAAEKSRSIPACAGEPGLVVVPASKIELEVYPRVCGGTTV